MTPRERAIEFLVQQLGAPVLMGHRGDLRFDRATRRLLPHGLGTNVWDCSGLFCGALLAAGGPDLRGTHNAQLLHDAMGDFPALLEPRVGDGVFYGHDAKRIVHVGIWAAGGKVFSADGATWGITDLRVAIVSRCKVRLHPTRFFRPDLPFVTVRRNLWMDALYPPKEKQNG